MTRLIVMVGAALGALTLVACDSGTPEGGETQRPALDERRAAVASGKADNSGSCEGACGGQSADGCWCDDACDNYGDCCADKKDVCDGCGEVMCTLYCEHGFETDEDGCQVCSCKDAPAVDPKSCAGSCGEKAPGGCWCDAQCAQYGDCCADKAEICDAPVCQPVMCELFCEHGFQTNPQGCEICKCNPPPPVAADSCADRCGEQAPAGCWCDAQCAEYGDCCADKAASCDAPEPEPECVPGGCSGQLCVEAGSPGGITTCEFLPWYACFKQDFAVCERQADGSCGWTPNDELTVCIGQGADCSDDSDCQTPLKCHGVPPEGDAGKCVDTRPIPGLGDPCAGPEDCGSGLTCVGHLVFGEGTCSHGWMAETFQVGPAAIPAGEKVELVFDVYGLATVPVESVITAIDLDVETTTFSARLRDPNGVEAAIWELLPAGEVPATPILVPAHTGDDTVNGPWTLILDNEQGAEDGQFGGASLWISSRWD